jgi:hypothetical protein
MVPCEIRKWNLHARYGMCQLGLWVLFGTKLNSMESIKSFDKCSLLCLHIYLYLLWEKLPSQHVTVTLKMTINLSAYCHRLNADIKFQSESVYSKWFYYYYQARVAKLTRFHALLRTVHMWEIKPFVVFFQIKWHFLNILSLLEIQVTEIVITFRTHCRTQHCEQICLRSPTYKKDKG